MAFSFIKKVFTFGPDKAEEPKPVAVETTVADVAVAPAASPEMLAPEVP
jgi:fused signal recognition particle receptor